MARPKKEGVDYFSHDVSASGSRTLFTLESKFGNDGYAFWFKLLETLGSQSELYYDCRNPANWLFLTAKTRVSEVMATEILDTLSQVDAIDADLWRQKIIWVQKFSDRLSDVFHKRGAETPNKPNFCNENPTKTAQSVAESTQSKVKESKVNKSKEESTPDEPATEPRQKDIGDLYEQVRVKFIAYCPSLPKPNSTKEWSLGRKKAIRDKNITVEQMQLVFERIEKSDFLTGRTGKWNGCCLDWILKPSNWQKINEGNYDNRENEKQKKETTYDLDAFENFDGEEI